VAELLSDEDKEELQALTDKDKSEINDGELTRLTKLALERKFDYPEWGLFFEVTGKNGKRADAIAYNLFPSRNFKTIGLEIKASRSDWKSELEKPSKNDWFVGQVDEFYVVAAKKGIVKESELPEGWGLFEMKGGGKLYEVVESNLTEHQDREMDSEFYMRGVKKAVEKMHDAQVSKKYARKEGYRKGKKEGQKEENLDYKSEKMIEKGEKFEELRDKVNVSLYRLNDEDIELLNKALDILKGLDGGYRSVVSELEKLQSKNGDIHEKIYDLKNQVEDLGEELDEKEDMTLEKFGGESQP
jgi:hypothetical protein